MASEGSVVLLMAPVPIMVPDGCSDGHSGAAWGFCRLPLCMGSALGLCDLGLVCGAWPITTHAVGLRVRPGGPSSSPFPITSWCPCPDRAGTGKSWVCSSQYLIWMFASRSESQLRLRPPTLFGAWPELLDVPGLVPALGAAGWSLGSLAAPRYLDSVTPGEV